MMIRILIIIVLVILILIILIMILIAKHIMRPFGTHCQHKKKKS